MAAAQCKRGKARDKDSSGTATPAHALDLSSETPAAVLGMELEKLCDHVLACVQEREQKLWSLQLDVRDLRHQIEDKQGRADTASAQALAVRFPPFLLQWTCEPPSHATAHAWLCPRCRVS